MDESDDFWADTKCGFEDTSFDECPLGYTFPCCGKNGEAEGCQQFLHVPDR